VTQEVALAVTAQVLCGFQSCSWNAITRLVKYVYDNDVPALLGGNHFHWAGNIVIVRRAQRGDLMNHEIQKLGNIDGLLWQTKIFDATIPHDKVYGLLGLTSSSDSRHITVDYDMLCEKLYTQVAL
jgi:hypothetical protein